MDIKSDKAFRLMYLSEKLNRGEKLIKSRVIAEFEIPDKTFQRDIDSLRQYYSERGIGEVIYNKKSNCYYLETNTNMLTQKEIYAICKILIESRAFNRAEFNSIIDKLLYLCDENESKEIKRLIGNEYVNYIPIKHGKHLIDMLWMLADTVNKQQKIIIDYTRADGKCNKHTVKPVGIMFSEFYFYLIVYMVDNDNNPIVFRVDRINNVEYTNQKFDIPYADKFNESEFRKRVQFMYCGELKHVRFLYNGVLEALLDRIPTAHIEKETNDGYIIRAESYGAGIDIWLDSQGDRVRLLDCF